MELKAVSWQGVGSTRKNRIAEYEKPNEDHLVVDNARRIYMVLDGVSRTRRPGMPYGIPSPAAIVARLFADVAHAALISSGDESPADERLRRAASAANDAIADYNREAFPEIDYLENNPAGCVALIGLALDDDFHYLYLGDCSGRVFGRNDGMVFTTSQTAALRDASGTLGLTGDEGRVRIRRDICNNRTHDCGYGVFNGAPGAMDFLVYGTIPLTGSEAILLATDGMDPLFETYAARALPSLDPEDLINLAEKCEHRYPEQRSDDKTVVVIGKG